MDEAESVFPPDSMIRRVNREALVLLGGGRSVLLQLAHPLVAAGVAEYSRFQSDPLARLFRTLRFMHTVVYDDRGRSAALRRFHAMHERIRGRLAEGAGSYPAGTAFRGDDADLKLWVHATFVDSTVKTYEWFVAPLSPTQREEYYADTLTLARLLGIPDAILPPSLEALSTYVDRTVSGGSLTVTDLSRGLAEDVLYPDVGLLPSVSAALLRFVTAGLLPERLRREFGLRWSPGRERLLGVLGRTTRRVRPAVPPAVWAAPLRGGRLAALLLGDGPVR